jgi:hypothetical protein
MLYATVGTNNLACSANIHTSDFEKASNLVNSALKLLRNVRNFSFSTANLAEFSKLNNETIFNGPM